MDPNYYGALEVPVLGIRLEQLILILYPTFLIPAVFFWYTHLRKRKTEALNPSGCRKLGITKPSHMTDEYESQYDDEISDKSQWRIKAIHMHPIKSCGSVELDEAEVDATGIVWDRKFAFAELLPQRAAGDATDSGPEHKWTFRTLRTPGFEKLALVKPEVWVPINSSAEKTSTLRRIEKTGALIIKYPNVPSGPLAFLDRYMIKHGFLPSESSFQVPLIPLENHTYPSQVVNIWGDDPTWLNYGVHVPDDFKQYIGAKHPLSLFRADPNCLREVHRNAPKEEDLGYQPTVGFADYYPLHLLNLASVHDVGNRIKDSISKFSAKRFRSNILIVGPKPYDEDDWKRFRLISTGTSTNKGTESHEFHCACHTVRCRLPNVDPATSERHPVEPDKTLKSFRCIDEGDSKNACLGLQVVPGLAVDGNGRRDGKITIRVGDRIEVLERGKHVYIRRQQ